MVTQFRRDHDTHLTPLSAQNRHVCSFSVNRHLRANESVEQHKLNCSPECQRVTKTWNREKQVLIYSSFIDVWCGTRSGHQKKRALVLARPAAADNPASSQPVPAPRWSCVKQAHCSHVRRVAWGPASPGEPDSRILCVYPQSALQSCKPAFWPWSCPWCWTFSGRTP